MFLGNLEPESRSAESHSEDGSRKHESQKQKGHVLNDPIHRKRSGQAYAEKAVWGFQALGRDVVVSDAK